MSSETKSSKKAPPSTDSSAALSTRPPRKKFKYTRELLRIATNDGMTQDQIATVCRVSQPVVSKWVRGESQGTEQALAPLLKRYGSRLSRGTSRVYLAMDDPDPRWENSKIGKQLLDALVRAPAEPGDDPTLVRYQVRSSVVRELADSLGIRLPRIVNWDDVLECIQIRFAGGYPSKPVEVNGPIIFRYTFNRLDGRLHREGIEPLRSPVARWLLHDGMRSKFVLVRQYRRHLNLPQLEHWAAERERQQSVVLASVDDELSSKQSRFLPVVQRGWLDCADDAGRWMSRIERPMSLEELLNFVDCYIEDGRQIHTIHDQMTIPFLIRKALIERRYSVPGVDRIADYE